LGAKGNLQCATLPGIAGTIDVTGRYRELPCGGETRAPLQSSRAASDLEARPSTSRADPPAGATSLPHAAAGVIATDVPARLDSLPFGRFHVLVIVALGVTWILDGLEVTMAGALSGTLKEHSALGLSNTDVGLASSAYLAGAVAGALFFGWLTDRLGRRRLFFTTLAVYLVATAATALSWNFWSFAVFRMLTGAGIGGEYTAINSTIQELIPARMRGWSDLAINGSFWIGAAMSAVGAIVLLDPAVINPAFGWRLAFFIGAALGAVILVMRLWIPESPRWLMTHGDPLQADAIVADIEDRLLPHGREAAESFPRVRLHTRTHTPLIEVARTLFRLYPQRTFVGLSLMAAQAFFYNAIFFTQALILTDFYGVPADRIGWYILPFAAGNFLGPLVLGRLFDVLGRRVMISLTYALSGLLLTVTGYLFQQDLLTAQTQTIAWMIVFFFASAAASSAYLTVSEIFPLELRALAIAFFYAIGTGVGGIAGPLLFGFLINTGSRSSVAIGYWIGAILMVVAAAVQAVWGVAAERKPLEAVSRPLAFVD
jgi:MFS family permease